MRKLAKTETVAATTPPKILTCDEVRNMEVGRTVQMRGEDRNGNQRIIVCTVATREGLKFLTYRQKGEIRQCAIKDYPGKQYTITV